MIYPLLETFNNKKKENKYIWIKNKYEIKYHIQKNIKCLENYKLIYTIYREDDIIRGNQKWPLEISTMLEY